MVDFGVGYCQGPDHFKVALDNQKKYQANWKPATFMLKEVCEGERRGGEEARRRGGEEARSRVYWNSNHFLCYYLFLILI